MGAKRFAELGRFVWHDLMTTDVPRARDFYQKLLGWSYQEVDMGPEMGTYPMIAAGGMNQGGLVGLDGSQGIPSHWIGYVTVPDVDAAVDRAQELGGTAPVPGTDIPGVGRFAVIQDAQGAVFSPFTGGDPEEEWPELLPHGAFCWDELSSPDPAAAKAFYSPLLGWRTQEVPMGETGTYHLFQSGGAEPRAGLMPTPPGAAGPPCWLPYIQVTDVDAIAARVPDLGGKVFVAPQDIPGVGRFSVAADPTGAMIAFLTPAVAPQG